MLTNMIYINKDQLDYVCDHLNRIINNEQSKILEISPETRIVQHIVSKLRENISTETLHKDIYTVMRDIYTIFLIISEISELEENYDIIMKILDLYKYGKDILMECSRIEDTRIRNVISRVTKKNVDINKNSKIILETLITSRNYDKVFQKVKDLGIKDRISQMMILALDYLLRDTTYDIAGIEKIQPHVDIHIAKVLLRLGVLCLDRTVLSRYVEHGKYIIKILPICAKLAPDEPFKTVWEVLRRRCIEAIFEISRKSNIIPILLSFYISGIGRQYCVYNDNERATQHYCPIKNVRTCPLSTVCRTYVGLNNILIMSRRQLRMILRFIDVPKKYIEDACELLVIL